MMKNWEIFVVPKIYLGHIPRSIECRVHNNLFGNCFLGLGIYYVGPVGTVGR